MTISPTFFRSSINIDGYVLEFDRVITKAIEWLITDHHYARRMPTVAHAFALWCNGEMCGAITFGPPASRSVQLSVAPSMPNAVIELNRLIALDHAPRNTESWMISEALSRLPSFLVISYADSAHGHKGTVYRAANFFYAGWTDMDRASPRFDYVTPGKHSRSSFRSGEGVKSEKVRRKPKARYWTATGSRKEKRTLRSACAWPSMNWKDHPPPNEHLRLNSTKIQ